jgi:hypothetical protein
MEGDEFLAGRDKPFEHFDAAGVTGKEIIHRGHSSGGGN